MTLSIDRADFLDPMDLGALPISPSVPYTSVAVLVHAPPASLLSFIVISSSS